MVENISGIYMIRNRINQKAYIGGSSHILNRIKRHIGDPANPNLKADLEKYGIEKFMFTILEFCFKWEHETNESFFDRLLEREQFYLDTILKASTDKEYFSKNGYNINYKSIGAEGITRSAASRQKMSNSRSGITIDKSVIDKAIATKRKNHTEKIITTYGSIEAYKEHQKQVKKEKKLNRLPTISYIGIPIACFDLNGVFIKRFQNQVNAGIEFGIAGGNISKAIKNFVTCKGMYWTLYTPESENGITTPSREKYLLKDAVGNKLATFPNPNAIAKWIGCHHTNVLNYLKRENCIKLFMDKYIIDEL